MSSYDDTRVIIFTTSTCYYCNQVKKALQSLIQNGDIEIIDLNKLSTTSKEMIWFTKTSKTRGVPALVYIQDGKYVGGVVGANNVLEYINNM